MEKEVKEKEYRIIIKPSVARKLLKLGNVICDIKPNKINKCETVFVFTSNDKFKNDLNSIIKK